MFPPVESQVIFLSKETPIVSVGLRTAEVSYTDAPSPCACTYISSGAHVLIYFLLTMFARPAFLLFVSFLMFRFDTALLYQDSGADPGFVVRGGVSRRGVWGRLRSPAGPRQSPGRGPRGRSPLEALELWGITDIYLNDNFEPTTPFLSDQKNLTLSLNFVG
jgi:hypothetical protein